MNIDTPNTVNSSYTKVNCGDCEKGFKNNQGYGLHKLTCNTLGLIGLMSESYFHN